MNSDNLISTLEQSLHQMRSARNRAAKRLEQVKIEIAKLESEASFLIDEMEALESSAIQTKNAMESLLEIIKK